MDGSKMPLDGLAWVVQIFPERLPPILMKLRTVISLLASPLLLQGAKAQYVVDQDLGDLNASTPRTIVANTAASSGSPARDEAQFHSAGTNQGRVWGNERVFQFELTEPAILTLSTNGAGDIVGDPDFILLEGLSVAFDPDRAKYEALDALGAAFMDVDGPQTESLGAFFPGTYYIAVENYEGTDFEVSDPSHSYSNSSCTVQLEALSADAEDFWGYLGVVAGDGSTLYFETLDSTLDTAIAVFNASGTLLIENDDASETDTQSVIALADGLPSGTYYLAVGGKGTDFSGGLDNMVAGPSVEGDFILTHSLGESFSPESVNGVIDLTYDQSSIRVFEFFVGPKTPESFTSIGEIALEDEPFDFDLLDSDFDTQLTIYDSQGFWIYFNDDFEYSDDGDDTNDTFQSFLELDEGLPAGTYYVVITGYNNDILDGFSVFPDSEGTDSGSYELKFPGGTRSGGLASGGQVWFQFTIGEVVSPPVDIEVTAVEVVGDQLTLEWVAQPNAVYQVYSSTTGGSFTLVPGQDAILTDTTTFTIDGSGEPVKLFQIREVIPN